MFEIRSHLTIVTVGPPFSKMKKQTTDPTINLVLDTLQKSKQALVFVNTKRSAEKQAENISKKIKNTNLLELENKIRKTLPTPTKQCERLATCVKRGIAFHHAGLHAKQREIIEDNFKKGIIKIICATPTLAFGVDTPAYRAIIKDLKRHSNFGMSWIPVLEYLQMCGRAGRPNYDNCGQAIVIAKTEAEKDELTERYINGQPEEILSKLAVEPVLRTYLLSLISTNFVRNKKQILLFFSKTFWAHQFKDMPKLESIIEKMLKLLEDFEFITIHSIDQDFVSANEIQNDKITPTLLGRRVSELYLDPITANRIIKSMEIASATTTRPFSYLQLISNSLEMMPFLRVRQSEFDFIQEELIKLEPYLLENPPHLYDPEYQYFLDAIKTALMFNDWIDEQGEEILLEKYNIRPGELHAKKENADWLLYATAELCKILKFQPLLKDIAKLRLRLKYGVREELLALLQLKQIGKVRARQLYRNKIKTLGDLRNTDLATLAQIIGAKTAAFVKEQLGQHVGSVPANKRTGQIGLKDYT